MMEYPYTMAMQQVAQPKFEKPQTAFPQAVCGFFKANAFRELSRNN